MYISSLPSCDMQCRDRETLGTPVGMLASNGPVNTVQRCGLKYIFRANCRVHSVACQIYIVLLALFSFYNAISIIYMYMPDYRGNVVSIDIRQASSNCMVLLSTVY